MYFTDNELAVKWWNNLSAKEKYETAKTVNMLQLNLESLTMPQIEWIWRAQQKI